MVFSSIENAGTFEAKHCVNRMPQLAPCLARIKFSINSYYNMLLQPLHRKPDSCLRGKMRPLVVTCADRVCVKSCPRQSPQLGSRGRFIACAFPVLCPAAVVSSPHPPLHLPLPLLREQLPRRAVKWRLRQPSNLLCLSVSSQYLIGINVKGTTFCSFS